MADYLPLCALRQGLLPAGSAFLFCLKVEDGCTRFRPRRGGSG